MKDEFVMVRRNVLARLQENMDPHRGAVAWGIVCELLALPRRGEPLEIDEQVEFMAWANEEYQVGADEALNLKNPRVRDNKIGWLARAALERKS